MNDKLVDLLFPIFNGDKRRVMYQNYKGYDLYKESALSKNDWEIHLKGDQSLAIYLLDENCSCSTICLDIDIPKIEIPASATERENIKKTKFLPEVKKIIEYVNNEYSATNENYLIEDTGGRGYHIWMFLRTAVKAECILPFLRDIKLSSGFEGLELFPSNSEHGKKGYSKSLVRLPLGVHRKYNLGRSFFLNADTQFQAFESLELINHLRSIKFIENEVLTKAQAKYQTIIQRTKQRQVDFKNSKFTNRTTIGTVGQMTSLCPALSTLVSNAQKHSHLKHHERMVLSTVLQKFDDGEEKLHQILSCCSDYDEEVSKYQINSLKGYNPPSCKSLQSEKYRICSNWCNKFFEKRSQEGKNPSPIWFSNYNLSVDEIPLDGSSLSELEQVASLDNLSRAWKQAKHVARDREVFDDYVAFDLFEKNLWGNLLLLRHQLLNGRWEHNNFLLIQIPKSKDDRTFRPFCSTSPREAIVQLAILNVIGPTIDSVFNNNSFGNRLAISPKADSELFIDWKKQNKLREFKKQGFSKYPKHSHYILTDIKQFYEFISHDKLMSILRMYTEDQGLLNLIQQYIEAPWDKHKHDYGGEKRKIGIPQGPALSAFLANLYLDEIDQLISSCSITFVRYVDDFAILYENRESAVAQLKELQSELKNYGLELSSEKTTFEPLQVTDTKRLTNWLDEVRYDFVKSYNSAIPITDNEKEELFEILNNVAGNGEGDLSGLTKYLGFYIRYTERINHLEILKGVYAIAVQILHEERPKHNATCIAIKSLIKACSDFKEDAWSEFEPLLVQRTDEYFKVLFCQEARKLIEENNEFLLYPAILSAIFQLSINSENPVSAAAALLCLEKAQFNNSYVDYSKVFNIALGSSRFLRPYALYLLNRKNQIIETTLARIIPETLFEFELFLDISFTHNRQGYLDPLLKIIGNDLHYTLILSLVLNCSIKYSLKEGFSIYENRDLSINEKDNLAYYVSEKLIKYYIHEFDATPKVKHFVTFLISIDQLNIAKEIYKLARFASILPEQDDLLFLQEQKSDKDDSAFSVGLPVFSGLTLKGPIHNNYFIQLAQDESGKQYYHEVLDNRELVKSGKDVTKFSKVVAKLRENNILLFSSLEIRKETGHLLLCTEVKGDTVSLFSWLRENRNITAEMISSLLDRICALFKRTKELLEGSLNEVMLVPVPCLHSIYINQQNELFFGTISLTIGSERKYIGLSSDFFLLDSDEWHILAFGLLTFEIITHHCSIKELVRENKIEKSRIQSYITSHGLLFADIVTKSTRFHPESRYHQLEFLINDVNQWSALETGLLSNVDLSETDKKILRSLWALDVRLERALLANKDRKKNLVIQAHNVQNIVIKFLKTQELLNETWLADGWSILEPLSKYERHIASIQLLSLGEMILTKIQSYKLYIPFTRELSISTWLKASAAGIEFESLRRSTYLLVITPGSNENLQKSFLFIEEHLKLGSSIQISSSEVNHSLDEVVTVLQNNLIDVVNRIRVFQESQTLPELNLNYDILVVLFSILINWQEITLTSEEGYELSLKRNIKLLNDIDVLNSLKNLSSYHVNYSRKGSKTLNELMYLLLVQASLNDVNLQLFRRVTRYYGHLQRSIFGKLGFGGKIDAKIDFAKSTVHIPSSAVIKECHLSLESCCLQQVVWKRQRKKKICNYKRSFQKVT